MLLGQAESGKSTLQKQFQLYYASQTLDRERPSWRPIVYANILKALRMLFDELDRQYPSTSASLHQLSNEPSTAISSISASSSNSSATAVANSSWPHDLQHFQTALASLIAAEDTLASEVSGGISVSGGRTGVYVRAGWQTLITPHRTWGDIRGSAALRDSDATTLVDRLLRDTKSEIADFWHHPVVKQLLSSNKVRLEESAALSVSLCFLLLLHIGRVLTDGAVFFFHQLPGRD
jgi:guanine nucleotide-binding protein alpha-1 subunit